MAHTIKAAKLRTGDWFIDPHREGRRPAKVIRTTGIYDGRVHLILNDNAPWGAWAASYNAHQDLELA